MFRKVVSQIMLILLLSSGLALILNSQSVKATRSIEIREDGTIYPPTAPIKRDGEVYTLTGDISQSIIVLKNNIVIDGNNHIVDGGLIGDIGIDLSDRFRVRVKNITIKNFRIGIHLYGSSYYNEIANSTIIGCGTGIVMKGFLDKVPHYNKITANVITDSTEGGVLITPYQAGSSDKPHHNTISQNIITKNEQYGVRSESYYNELTFNVVKGNKVGVLLYGDASNNTVSFNTIIDNAEEGLCVQGSHNKIFNNTIMGNKYGVYIKPTGIIGYSGYCCYNEIYNNIIANNTWYGIYIEAETQFYKTSNNRIYHNDFINNTVQAYSYNSENTWDDGYPSGGNYWSDYNGTDLYSGPYQNKTGGDGIGDTPYAIDAVKDQYPLMEPYIIPELPSTTTLSLFTSIATLTLIAARKKLQKQFKV